MTDQASKNAMNTEQAVVILLIVAFAIYSVLALIYAIRNVQNFEFIFLTAAVAIALCAETSMDVHWAISEKLKPINKAIDTEWKRQLSEIEEMKTRLDEVKNGTSNGPDYLPLLKEIQGQLEEVRKQLSTMTSSNENF